MNKEVNESKLRKWLFNEISFLLGLGAVIISIAIAINGADADLNRNIDLIQKDIEIIKTNDLSHISEKINKNFDRSERNEDKLNEMNLKIERIITILDNK